MAEEPFSPYRAKPAPNTKGWNQIDPERKQLKNIFSRTPSVYQYKYNKEKSHSTGEVLDAI